MSLAELLTLDPVTISPDSRLAEAVELMDLHDIRHLPVLVEGELVGMISDRDLLAATGWKASRLSRLWDEPSGFVRDLPLSKPLIAHPDEDSCAVARRMLEYRVDGLPVLADGRLVGIVTDYDYLTEYVLSCRVGRVAPGEDRAVSECMSWKVETIQRKATISDAFSHMHRVDVLHLPVLDGERLVGIVSDRDFRLHLGRGTSVMLPVQAICSHEPITVEPERALSEAVELLLLHKIGALPVTREGLLIGLLTSSSVLAVCAAF